MAEHILTGFGFGPIQGGLFIKEAVDSTNFKRIVISEIDQKLVEAVRANNGSYYINIAHKNCIETVKIDNVELLNPNNEQDRNILIKALTESTEIVTSLPSVNFYDTGENSIVSLIAQGLKNTKAKATIIYTAENNNMAAEILEEKVAKELGCSLPQCCQFLNTVIGKMSGVITEPAEIEKLKLKTITPHINRAFLVEEFNRILVTKTTIPNFKPGIEVFIEKTQLLPFEEMKLYGHNTLHTLLGFLGCLKSYTRMTELENDSWIMDIAKKAAILDSGKALIKKYASLNDEVFSEQGYKNYAEDLLKRITSPYLNDTTIRAARDPVRKLGLTDRIFGTMTLALQQGIEPLNIALGAAAGLAVIIKDSDKHNLPLELRVDNWSNLKQDAIPKILNWIWQNKTNEFSNELIKYVQDAYKKLVISTNEQS
ncbi:MAG: mannitol dehydrogenase family protein [Planctomycetota bacterium]|jgi:mannitol-1-phosphate 5-dehydrogenase